MAKLRKRGKYWYIDYSKDGRRIKKSVGTSKATAETILKDLEVKLAREETGLFLKEIKISDFLDKMEVYYKAHHRDRTLVRYKSILDHFRRYLGDKAKDRLSSLRPSDFEEYKVFRAGESKRVNFYVAPARKKPISKNTISMELKILKSAFKFAKRWGHVRDNPMNEVEYFKKQKKDPRFYTIEELIAILNASEQPYYDVFSILFSTGLRRDELRFLEVEDINFDKQLIYIRKKSFWQPKTGEHQVPIYDDILPILRKRCQERQTGFLFVQDGTQKPHCDSRWYNYLDRIRTRLNLPQCGVHVFRHTLGSLTMAEDMNIKKLQEILGHTDIKTTQIYSNMEKKYLVTGINQIKSIGYVLSQTVPKASQSEYQKKTLPQHIEIKQLTNGAGGGNRTLVSAGLDKLQYCCMG